MTTTLPFAESLTIEFKSDRAKLPDRELTEAIICLANTEGGELWLGVEDDGLVTGLHPDHLQLAGLEGMIAARTAPALAVKVSAVNFEDKVVARIAVPRAQSEVCTSTGVYVRRRLKYDGTPECVPMLPHDRSSRGTSYGLSDASAQAVAGSQLSDLDPLERERLRQGIDRYGGDRSLLELDDEALDGALGFTARQVEGNRIPTLTGMLLLGREEALKRLVSTHELAFQVLAQEAVEFNEFRRFPLLKALDWLETNFRPYNPEKEVQIDLFRVPIPRVDPSAFREAVANALVHRDYHRLGTIHIRLTDEHLVVSNPGGLVEGVTLSNLLTTEPRPRNPALADAMKRIGIVERSGRGVDTIYRGMLRFGRPEPDYQATSSTTVVLRLATVNADIAFLKLVIDEERRNKKALPIDSLIALASLRAAKRMSAEDLAVQIHRDAPHAKRTLETLVEAGIVDAHGGTPRTRSYTLSAKVYRNAGNRAGFTRQAGFSAIQHESMVMSYVQQHGEVRRADIVELCRVTDEQAKQMLKKLKVDRRLLQHGLRRATFYTIGPGAE
jgi:ATP-dependent DNA helicase RecG